MSKRRKDEDIFMNNDKGESISMLAEISMDPNDMSPLDFEKEIPVLPLRNLVMFPMVVMPITIGRSSTLKLVNSRRLSGFR